MNGMSSVNAPTRLRRVLATAALASLTVVAAACGDDDSSATTTAPAAAETTTSATIGTVSVDKAWARNSPSAATAGAVYMTITSPAGDALVGAKVDASVAATAEVHEVVMASGMATDTTMGSGMAVSSTMAGGMSTDTTMAGTGEMTMRPVDRIELNAGEPLMLKPGSYHIMLMDLVKPLELGTTIKVTLVFEKAGDVTVDVPVLEEAP